MEKGEEIGDLRTSSFDATWQLGRLPPTNLIQPPNKLKSI